MTIREETAGDQLAIRRIHELAFGQPDEAELVDRLRAEGHARLSLVAQRGAELVGHLLLSELAIVTAAGPVASLALAPMAVLPDFQRQGFGSQLVRAAIDLAQQRGHTSIIVLGHPHFYRRFGFSPELAAPLASPFPPEAFMALELQPAALRGVAGRVAYPPPFGLE